MHKCDTAENKYNIQSDINTLLLGKDSDVEKMMRFFDEIKIFEEI